MKSKAGEVALLLAALLVPGCAQLNPADLQKQLAQVSAAQAADAPVAPAETSVQPVQQLVAVQQAGKVQAKQPASDNPVLNLYLQETLQYEKDAAEAEKAAAMYQKMTHDVLQGPLKADTSGLTAMEMGRIGVNNWGHAVLSFEDMLHAKAGALAAAAAAKAAKPYNDAVAAYAKAQGAYDSTAMAYDLRIPSDEANARKLITYANQYRLQGNDGMADKYDNMATAYVEQAETFAGQARSYYNMAVKINGATPGIQKMAGIAGTKAAWMKDPAGTIPQSHLFPFTPVPPLEFVQTDSTEHREASPAPAPSLSFLGWQR